MNTVLSIIIPVYNVERYIGKCLDSIFLPENEELPFEVIVVDDGSPDSSMDIVDGYTSKYSNLKIVHQENQGLSCARNTGLLYAQGDYVWFVDSDDWLNDGALPQLMNILRDYPGLEVLVAPGIWIYEDGRRSWTDMILEDYRRMTGKELIDSSVHCSPWHFVISRQLIEGHQLRFIPHVLHEDGPWYLMTLYFAEYTLQISTPLYCYRQREGSIMASLGIRSGYDVMEITRQLNEFCNRQVAFADHFWFKRLIIFNMLSIVHKLWSKRHTPEFIQFMADTRSFRQQICQEYSTLRGGGISWFLKCQLMRFPMLFERLRQMKRYLK